MKQSRQRKKIIIIGASGHGRAVQCAVNASRDYVFFGFADDDSRKKNTIGTIARMSTYYSTHYFVVAIGDNEIRQKIYRSMKRKGARFINVIHPTAVIEAGVQLGEGIMVGGQAYINRGARIGDNTIINTGVIIEHDTSVGSHVHVAPGVVTGGTVRIGDGAWVGLGSLVRNNISIGSNCFIGMGSNVVSDTVEGYMYYGNPAKKIRRLKRNDA